MLSSEEAMVGCLEVQEWGNTWLVRQWKGVSPWGSDPEGTQWGTDGRGKG